MAKRKNRPGPKPHPLSYMRQLNIRVNDPIMESLEDDGEPSVTARALLVQIMLDKGWITLEDLPPSDNTPATKGKAKAR